MQIRRTRKGASVRDRGGNIVSKRRIIAICKPAILKGRSAVRSWLGGGEFRCWHGNGVNAGRAFRREWEQEVKGFWIRRLAFI